MKVKILIDKIKKHSKEILAIATVIAALAAAYSALQSKNLIELNLRPYVTPKDYKLTIIDKTETPIKEITLKDAFPTNAIPAEKIGRIILAINFNNPGRLFGLIKINKISSSFGNINGVEETKNQNLLVSGLSDSGPLLGIDITNAFYNANSFVDFNYDLENYSDEINFKKNLNFSIRCDFRQREYNGSFNINPNCFFTK